MKQTIDLSGIWKFAFSEGEKSMPASYEDTILLPGTTSISKKGPMNESKEIGYLTDTYLYEGAAWYERDFTLDKDSAALPAFLTLERTRKTTVYLNTQYIGQQESLSTPHRYDLSGYLHEGNNRITIMVENANYLTKGGHLTSPDTQTNWNGITGDIGIDFYPESYLSDLMIYTDIHTPSVTVKGKLIGAESASVNAFVTLDYSDDDIISEVLDENTYHIQQEFSFTYDLPKHATLWSEHTPALHQIHISLGDDIHQLTFGLREFIPCGDKFTINGHQTFLRGKHDGLIFPLTGAAPTTTKEWLYVMEIAKSYGINHYRFHTCCPPDAAFCAADLLGIYMEPELPFWGTLYAPGEDGFNEEEQNYLIEEGIRMLKEFGNHPSFTLFSLGNELWGSKERMAEIILKYKSFDNRHLYTQGSNNFQWTPLILPVDDFFCGVRFTKERRIRGSYAMCDAPLGHVQTAEPSTMMDYDDAIHPQRLHKTDDNTANKDEYIKIQYETGVKRVKAEEAEELIPSVPVISHEIGQYQTYVNFKEIDKYTGSIKARNFEVFKDRLSKTGMLSLSERFFYDSGKLAMDCYQEELEAAFRSRHMAGFQILDLQDFSGQGTALVGVLDAFMDSKGLISPDEFRTFCSDAVLLARFNKFQYRSEETFKAHIELAYFRQDHLYGNTLKLTLGEQQMSISIPDFDSNYVDICDIEFSLPKVDQMMELHFDMAIQNTDIKKSYSIWVYPDSPDSISAACIEKKYETALKRLAQGESVLYLPEKEEIKNSIKGFYCTDFWCYPMFVSISKWMKKEKPIGTMGLTIDNRHHALKEFPCKTYSTKPWWNLVENSQAIILDSLPKEYVPIVQTIDNFDRNHKLGTLFECHVGKGKLLVCSIDFDAILEKPEAKQLLSSLVSYVESERFLPKQQLSIDELNTVFMSC